MDDPFATLGLPRRFSLSLAELAQRHRDLSRTLHPDRFVEAPAGERRMALERAMAVNEAWRTLRDPLTRALCLLRLAGVEVSDRERPDAALLMEVMDLREALDAVKAQPHRVAALRDQVAAAIARESQHLAAAFDGDAPPSPAQRARAREAAVKLRYYHRFEEEAEALEG